MWAKLNPATDKMLSSWMTWFYRRYQQYKDWGEVGEPAVMWLSGLHIPETYIAALVQVSNRALPRPLEASCSLPLPSGGLCFRLCRVP